MRLTPGQPVTAQRYLGQHEPWPEAVYRGPGPDLKSQSLRARGSRSVRTSMQSIKQGLVQYPDGEIAARPYDVIKPIEDA